MVHFDVVPGDVAADLRARADADRPRAGGDVPRYFGPGSDGDTLFGTEAAEDLVVPADDKRLGADVAVEATVVADPSGGGDPPGVVAHTGRPRDNDWLVLALVARQRLQHLLGGLFLADPQELGEIDDEECDRGHGVADDNPARGLEAVVDVDVVADVEVTGDLQLAADVDAFAEVGVLPDEDVAVDLTPHVQPAIARSLDVAAEADALACDDVPPADPELHVALPADEDVAVGYEVVFLDVGPVRDDQFVEWVRAEYRHSQTPVFAVLKA